MSDLRMAVVGVGALGRHHARILGAMAGVDLVAVADSHAERGQAVAGQCGCRWVADYRELAGQVDAVSVVVPTVAHREVGGYFLERGIPVLVEKPLADDDASGIELVELAERKGVALQVGHIERFNPAFVAAAPWLAGAKYIRAERTSPYTFRSTDIGVTLDLMIHDIDLVLSLVRSPLQSASAFGAGVMGGHEDAVQARLVFENGAIADLTASRVSPVVSRSLQVWSASGCVSVDLHKREVSRYAPSPALVHGPSPLELSRQPGADIEQLKKDVFGRFIRVETTAVPASDALTDELQSFVHAVVTKTAPPVDGRQALAALQVATAVQQSLARHRWDATQAGVASPQQAGALPQRKAG